MESGESIIGTASGVVRASDFGRKPEKGGRWSNDGVDGFKGAPWEPYPGAGGRYESEECRRRITEELTMIGDE